VVDQGFFISCYYEPMAKKKPLNFRQRKFCKLYVANGRNGAKAAREAGYSERTANKIAYIMLDKVRLRDEIERLSRGGLTHLDITIEKVMGHFAQIAFDKENTKKDQMKALTELKSYLETAGVTENDNNKKPSLAYRIEELDPEGDGSDDTERGEEDEN